MGSQSIQIVGRYLAKQARLLARSCAGDDREAALAFAELLSGKPEEALLAGQGAVDVSKREGIGRKKA